MPLGRERGLSLAFRVFGVATAVALVGHLSVLLWAQHAFSGVEAMVALHSNMLAHGEGLYRDLNQYPFTVSAYGPIFYILTAFLDLLGIPLYQSARSISVLALLATLWCGWHILGMLAAHGARVAGVLLAGATANIAFWGTTGQVDMLAIFFSTAAFWRFLVWREKRTSWGLAFSGILVLLAVFTKQTAVASGAAIACSLLWEDRKRGALWAGSVAAIGLACAFGVNTLNHGHFFENAVFANINPFRWEKLAQQAQYLLLTSGALIAIAAAGMRAAPKRLAPLYMYTGFASLVWLATASKVGSDLNYQIEMTLLWCLSAAVALDRLELFPKIVAGTRSWVTLLQIPLAFHMVLNLAVTGKTVLERAVMQTAQRENIAALRPYLGKERGLVLVAHYDAMLQTRGRIDVETLIYSLLVEAGRIDPNPVLRDLEARRFQTVVLHENVFTEAPALDNPERIVLPKAHLDAVRKNYRLVKHVEGPFLNGEFVYEPIRD